MKMEDQFKKPPFWATWILLRLSHQTDNYSMIDDLEIEYRYLVSERGYLYTFFWIMFQLFRSIPEFVVLSVYWRIIMFSNYIKVAFRNITKFKGYSFLNINA